MIKKRFHKFELKSEENESQLIEFGRFTEENRKYLIFWDLPTIQGGDKNMKKLMLTLLVLCIIISFSGCDLQGGSLSAEQQKAVDNSIQFINNFSFAPKRYIDTSIVKIKNVTDDIRNSVFYEDKKIEKNAIGLTDWVITIGDTSDHAFANIVCDSDTFEVIGYIPID